MRELSVTASDGHRFSLRQHAAAAARAIIVICPAMGVSAGYYDRFAEAIAASHGCHVAITDLRGQGSSSLRASRRVDWGYATMIERDWPALVEGLRQSWPGLPLYLLGHSQGGQLSLLYLARQPEGVDGVITIACGSTYFRGWPFPASLNILARTQFVRGPALALGYFPGNKLGFGGRQARSEMRDWANAALNGRYDLIDAGMDYEAALWRVSKPVRIFSLDGDDFAPRGAADVLVQKLPPARVQHHHLTTADLPAEALDHFRWSRSPQAVVPRLLASVGL
jgi:predicted alpha/beta hydrolase